MNSLKQLKTPAVSVLSAAARNVATRAFSSTPVVANNIRHELKQASNRDSTWSENQIEKKQAFKGPRFENADIDAQVTTNQPKRPADQPTRSRSLILKQI